MFEKLKKIVLARGKEPSTYRGIFMLLTALGVSIDPALATEIISAGMGIVGIIGIAFADKTDKN